MTTQETHLEMPVTHRVRALICRGEQVLLVRKEGGGRGERYGLPGGGANPGETLPEALLRECGDEIDKPVMVGALRHVAEVFRRKRAGEPLKQHIEYVFQADLLADGMPDNGPRPDSHQTGICWIDWQLLADLPEIPGYLPGCNPRLLATSTTTYLGAHYDDPFT